MTGEVSPKIGFLTREEFAALPGAEPRQHATCETERHEGQGLQAIAVIALAGPDGDMVWGACRECFAGIDNDLSDGSWYLNR